MKKQLITLSTIISASFFPLSATAAPSLSVDGSSAPGTITVGTVDFGTLLPAKTIYFGGDGHPAGPAIAPIVQSIGTPTNERGFVWPSVNFQMFGDSNNFFTTGNGAIQFSSPAQAQNVSTMYNITPNGAGSFVGSVGYSFPEDGTSYQDQAYGTYTVPITYTVSGVSVSFTLSWKVNARFKLLFVPTSPGSGNFGSMSFGEFVSNQTFVIATESNYSDPYAITMSTSGIMNQFGTLLTGVRLFSDGVSGNRVRSAEIPISAVTPLTANQEIVIYRSNQQGSSDFFNLGIAIVPDFGQQAGDYVGIITITMLTI